MQRAVARGSRFGKPPRRSYGGADRRDGRCGGVAVTHGGRRPTNRLGAFHPNRLATKPRENLSFRSSTSRELTLTLTRRRECSQRSECSLRSAESFGSSWSSLLCLCSLAFSRAVGKRRESHSLGLRSSRLGERNLTEWVSSGDRP